MRYMCITALAEHKLSKVYRQNKVYKHYHHNIPQHFPLQ